MPTPDRPEPTATERIINRHMARMLCDLEAAGCPVAFRDAVKRTMRTIKAEATAATTADAPAIVSEQALHLEALLNEAACPRLFVDEVASKMDWLRMDLRELDNANLPVDTDDDL